MKGQHRKYDRIKYSFHHNIVLGFSFSFLNDQGIPGIVDQLKQFSHGGK
jgi:hypothetical protein